LGAAPVIAFLVLPELSLYREGLAQEEEAG
jgi:hypothetical protein